MMRVTCPDAVCGRIFEADEKLFGHETKCPSCGSLVTSITAPDGRKRYELRDLVQGAVPVVATAAGGQVGERVKFPCGHCGAVISARAESRGKTISCPKCGQPNLVSGWSLPPKAKENRPPPSQNGHQSEESRLGPDPETEPRQSAGELARHEAAEQAEQRRLAAAEQVRLEAERRRLEAERANEAQRLAAEQARREALERSEREAAERVELERQEAAEKERLAAERQRLEVERAEETRRQAAELARHEAAERARREALERSQREAAEQAEQRRLAAAEQVRLEAERRRLEAERANEAQRLAAEQARREAEEQARREALERSEREAAERAERKRLQAEQRLEAERREKEARRLAVEQARHEAAQRASRKAEERAKQAAAERAERARLEFERREAEARQAVFRDRALAAIEREASLEVGDVAAYSALLARRSQALGAWQAAAEPARDDLLSAYEEVEQTRWTWERRAYAKCSPQRSRLGRELDRFLLAPVEVPLAGLRLSTAPAMLSPFRFAALPAHARTKNLTTMYESAEKNLGAALSIELERFAPAPYQVGRDVDRRLLTLPHGRILFELFWFHLQAPEFEVLRQMQSVACGAAFDYLTALAREPKTGMLGRHALAVSWLHAAIAREAAFASGTAADGVDYWDLAIEHWRRILVEDGFWNYLQSRSLEFGAAKNWLPQVRQGVPAFLGAILMRFARAYGARGDSVSFQRLTCVLRRSGLPTDVREAGAVAAVRASYY